MALILAVFCASTSKSQVIISLIFGDMLNSDKLEFGLDGGLNWSNISTLENSESQRKFNLGFYFNIKLQEKLFIRTGVLVKSTMGAEGIDPYYLDNAELDSALVGSSVNRKLGYFNVPVMLKYKFYNEFFIEAGPQLSLLNKARDEFVKEVNTKDDLVFTNNIRDNYKKFDAGLIGGVGYQLLQGEGMTFGIRYYYGLMDIIKENTGDSQANRTFYVYASIPIGAGKKKED